MAIKKSELYSSLWQSCDELRGGMDASQYKDYVLVLLFVKYVSDKYAGVPYAPITMTGLWVIFYFPPAANVKASVETPVKTPDHLLEVLDANPGMTLVEVAVSIGKSLSAVERASAKLVKNGRLRYVGPRKGGHWEILK